MISKKPFQLVSYDDELKKFNINPEATEILKGIQGKIKVVGIIGKYRTGKSYFLNRLLGVTKGGFELGHEVQGKTRGIWLWGKKDPNHQNSVLLAMDTEGLFDAKNNKDIDAHLFVLSILLSSYLICNIQGLITATDIENLGMVVELTKLLKTNNTKNDGSDFIRHFPHFMFLMRDFNKDFGEFKDEQDYLDNFILKESGNTFDEAHFKRNRIKSIIKQSFNKITCFTISEPVNDMKENLKKIEESTDILRPEFVKELTRVIQYVLEKAPFKKMTSTGCTINVDGSGFVTLLKSYVDAINDGKCPSIPDSLQAVINEKNNYVFETVKKKYHDNMEELRKSFPIDEETLIEKNNELMKECIKIITKDGMGQIEVQENQKKFNDLIIQKTGDKITGGLFYNYKQENHEKSFKLCSQVSHELLQSLKMEIESDQFKSMEDYNKRKNQVMNEFNSRVTGPYKAEGLVDILGKLESCMKVVMGKLQLAEAEKKREQEKIRHEQEIARLDRELKNAHLNQEMQRAALERLKHEQQETLKKVQVEKEKWEREMLEQKNMFEQKIEEAKRKGDEQLTERLEYQRKQLEENLEREIQKKNDELNTRLKEMEETHKKELEMTKKQYEEAQNQYNKAKYRRDEMELGYLVDTGEIVYFVREHETV